MTRKPKTAPAARDRTDGRRQILLYMKAELIAELKIEAIARGVNAYELAEEAVEKFLSRSKDRRGR